MNQQFKGVDALAAIKPHTRTPTHPSEHIRVDHAPQHELDVAKASLFARKQPVAQTIMPIDVDPDLHRAVKSAARKQKTKMNNLVSVAIAKISTELTNIPPDEYVAFFSGLQLPPPRPGIRTSLLMPVTAADTARDIAVRGGIKVKMVITAAFLIASGKSRIN